MVPKSLTPYRLGISGHTLNSYLRLPDRTLSACGEPAVLETTASG